MSEHHDFDWLSDGIAVVLRLGTLVSVGVLAIGYLIGLVAGFEDGERPLLELFGDRGPLTLVGLGLLAMTLLPVGVLIAASIGFARNGERSRLLISLAVLGLLGASLLAAAFLAGTG